MSGVTLDELLKELGTAPFQLDNKCTREQIQNVPFFLESWQKGATHLGLSMVEVEEVEKDGTEEREKSRMPSSPSKQNTGC